MKAADGLALIGSIYDAIGEDGAVSHVMANLSAHLGAKVAFWYVVQKGASGEAARSPFLFDGAYGVGADTLHEFREEMWRRDYALRAASVTDRTTETHELISAAELARNDFAQWIRTSAGVDRRIGRSTDLGDGVVAGWAFHMPAGLGRKSRERVEFDMLAPHVRNFFRLTSQFGEVHGRQKDLEQLINGQQRVIFLMAADGSVCWASDAAKRLSCQTDGIGCSAGVMNFARAKERQAFGALLRRFLTPQGLSETGPAQMIVERPHDAFPYVLEMSLAPTEFRTRIQNRAALIVTVHDPHHASVGRPEIWRAMFNLTRTEARVAMLTMRGLPDGMIANELGIGVGTVRTHQKHLLAKTETRSKAEAAHLLTRIT